LLNNDEDDADDEDEDDDEDEENLRDAEGDSRFAESEEELCFGCLVTCNADDDDDDDDSDLASTGLDMNFSAGNLMRNEEELSK
jgi:hypothetical protein